MLDQEVDSDVPKCCNHLPTLQILKWCNQPFLGLILSSRVGQQHASIIRP